MGVGNGDGYGYMQGYGHGLRNSLSSNENAWIP